MTRRPSFVLLVFAALVACTNSEPASPATTPTPESKKATVIIDTSGDSVLLTVDVADTPELRARGLMGRESLPDDYGMVFMFFEDTRSSFYMKDTLVPLSIAFFDVEGRITEILDMEPCRAEPCPLYSPRRAYRGALEVARGLFDTWGVRPGDRVRITQ